MGESRSHDARTGALPTAEPAARRIAATHPSSLLILVLTCALSVLVANHAADLNGPSYWKWRWRNLESLAIPAMLAGLVPFAAAQLAFARGKWPRWLLLLLVMATTFALEMIAASARVVPRGFTPISHAVYGPGVTSYFTDAATFTTFRDWLQSYPSRMPSFHLHSLNKPPLPILYYVLFTKIFGYNLDAALAAGIGVGILATLSVPATYVLIRTLAKRSDAAFHGASFIALSPSLVLFFPELDQVFPVLSCALLVTWARALGGGERRAALLFGLALLVASVTSYSFLVLGVFLALYSTVTLLPRPRGSQLARALAQTAIALASFLALQAVLVLATGYRPWQTFRTALGNQERLLASIPRPYPQTILFDLTDFALGAGWIAVPLVAYYFYAARKSLLGRTPLLAAAGLAQVAVVAAAALLPGETARVWLFLLPLLMLPIGLELARWTLPARLLVYLCLWCLTTVIAKNMRFVG